VKGIFIRMKLKFTCRNCKKTGFADLSLETHFVHAPWYTDYKGLLHNCIYCRSCGAVHDTTGHPFPPFGLIKLLFARIPSKVEVAHEFSEFKKITKINNPDFRTLASLHPIIINALIEDGRLTEEDEDPTEEPTVDFLLECLKDKSWVVRREAVIALERFADKRIIDSLIEALKDKHWNVRARAAIALGNLGDSRAIGPLTEHLTSGKWGDHFTRKELTIALKKLKGP
jgi:hypothetical protein